MDVSVVIPAHGNADKLPLVLAALAAQSYPERLMQTVVVDDGSDPPLTLPEIRPERTRIVRPDPSVWGPGGAVNTGVAVSEGAVVLRLDSDMLIHRDHVESQLRWHHRADYLGVIGDKRFVDFTPGDLSAQEAFEAVRDGRAAELFGRDNGPEVWIERILNRTDRLRSEGPRAYRVFTGATCSVRRELFDAVGGMDPTLLLGEDVELGYRLAQAGVVFIPELGAGAWHLGEARTRMRHEEATRYRIPSVGHRIPDSDLRRDIRGRRWQVPYVDAVIDVGDHPWERVRDTVDGLLTGEVDDVRVTLVGPWAELDADERRAPLDDPRLDLRLLRETYRTDDRVRFGDVPPVRDGAVPFRFTLPADSRPTRWALRTLIETADRERAGLVGVLLRGSGEEAPYPRLERTAAFARAYRLGATAADVDRLVDEIYGVRWVDGDGVFADDREHREPTPCCACQEKLEDARRQAGRERIRAERERARADRYDRQLRWLRESPSPGLWRRILPERWSRD
nr:glycosyltransferase [Nocardiopsis mwathae]